MGLFDFFKTDKKRNLRKIREKIEQKKNLQLTEWIDDVRKICSEKETIEIVRYYNLVFTQLKISVFTFLAPVNLKDKNKLEEFYSHKFSIGYLYSFLLSLLQFEDFMSKKDDQLLEIILPAMMCQIFEFNKEKSLKIYHSTVEEVNNNQSSENDFFSKGVDAAIKDWEKFVREDFKGVIGVNFSYHVDELKKDLE